MPIYLFQHPESGEQVEVLLGMNEDKFYIDGDGIEWQRVFLAPNATIDAELDPFSSRSFIDKTNSKGSMGDLMERSKEMSEKRKDKLGFDPVQKKYFEEYSKKRRGIKHTLDR